MQKDFITVTPDSGNGDATINVSASSHSDYMEGRNISLSVKGQGITKTIEIAQKEYWVKSNGLIKGIQIGNNNTSQSYELDEYNLQSSATEKSCNGWAIVRLESGFSGQINWEFQSGAIPKLPSGWRQYWFCEENEKTLLVVPSQNGIYIPNLNNLNSSWNGDYTFQGGYIVDSSGVLLAPVNMVLTLIIS